MMLALPRCANTMNDHGEGKNPVVSEVVRKRQAHLHTEFSEDLQGQCTAHTVHTVCVRADQPASTQKVMSCWQNLSTRPVEKAQLWELLAALPLDQSLIPSTDVGWLMLPPPPVLGDIKPYSGSSIYTQIKLKENFIGVNYLFLWVDYSLSLWTTGIAQYFQME